MKALSNKYDDGLFENLRRARETLLPPITPFTNVPFLNTDPQLQVKDLQVSNTSD